MLCTAYHGCFAPAARRGARLPVPTATSLNCTLPDALLRVADYTVCAQVHCTGNAGDVFLANYMTAHFIAPNTSADIRYAVYFRLSAPTFSEGRQHGGTRPASILDPWVDWHLGTHAGGGGGGGGAPLSRWWECRSCTAVYGPGPFTGPYSTQLCTVCGLVTREEAAGQPLSAAALRLVQAAQTPTLSEVETSRQRTLRLASINYVL